MKKAYESFHVNRSNLLELRVQTDRDLPSWVILKGYRKFPWLPSFLRAVIFNQCDEVDEMLREPTVQLAQVGSKIVRSGSMEGNLHFKSIDP